MSKAFGGIDNLLKPKHKRERAKVSVAHFAEVEAHRQFRAELQAIKDRLHLYGEEALSEEEKGFVASRPAFFYPGREE